MHARSALLSLALASFVSVASIPARAQSLADRETARSLMDEGDAKRDAKDYRAALKAYEAADAIMRVPSTGIEVARMQAQLGLLLEARETCARVSRIPPKPGEPSPFVAARKAADQLSDDLAKRIPSIQVQVTGAPPGQTPQVTIDGESIPAAVIGVPRKVNPGNRVVVAKLGAVEKREDVLIAEKETKTVTLDVTPPANSETHAHTQPQVDVRTDDGGGSTTRTALIIGGFTVGAIGIAVGSVTGLMHMSQVGDIKSECVDNKCPPTRAGDIEDAKTIGHVSTIAFAAGGVGVAVGIVGLLMASPAEHPEKKDAARARPVIGPTYLGLAGAF